MLTTQQAAEKLNLEELLYSSEDIAELARKGIFIGAKKSGNIWLIPEKSLDQFVIQQKNKSQGPSSQEPKRKKSFHELLRDPIWQGIGAIAGLIAIIPIIWGIVIFFTSDRSISIQKLTSEAISTSKPESNALSSTSNGATMTPFLGSLSQPTALVSTASISNLEEQTLEFNRQMKVLSTQVSELKARLDALTQDNANAELVELMQELVRVYDPTNEQLESIFSDTSLSNEDKVRLVKISLKRKIDQDSAEQANRIEELYSSPSIDVETMKLKRMIDNRNQGLETLRQIIDKYNETAKNIIDSVGR